MNNQELDQLLERLHDELEQADSLDEKGQDLLRHLNEDIRGVLSRSESGQPSAETFAARQVEESIAYFEVSHPKLTALLSELLTALSNAGL